MGAGMAEGKKAESLAKLAETIVEKEHEEEVKEEEETREGQEALAIRNPNR